jgi:hypothetical protein
MAQKGRFRILLLDSWQRVAEVHEPSVIRRVLELDADRGVPAQSHARFYCRTSQDGFQAASVGARGGYSYHGSAKIEFRYTQTLVDGEAAVVICTCVASRSSQSIGDFLAQPSDAPMPFQFDQL